MVYFRKFTIKRVCLLLSLILVLMTLLCGCSRDPDEDNRMSGSQGDEIGQIEDSGLQNGDGGVGSGLLGEASGGASSEGRVDKLETVYVKAAADGSVREISVEELLRNPGDGEFIEDFSALRDIKNMKGDEEFSWQGDSVLLWDNHGEDISYKGTCTGELPVSVEVSYFLDGKQVKPEEIAGKSGEICIRFDYVNHTAETVDVDGKKVQVVVPFAVLSALMLPSDIFSNVEVSGGKVLSMEDQNVVVGFAYPGLGDSLKLADYGLTEDFSITDYMEVTALASNFELDFTATVVVSGTFDDLDLSDLDDADELVESMAELTDASSKLVDGTSELLEGAETFQSYMKQYVQGVDAVSEGARALTDGLKTLNTEKANLAEGAAALQSGLESLNTALEQFSFPSSGNSEMNSGLAGTAQALISDAQALASQLAALQEGLNQIQSFASDAAQYTAAVQTAIASANEELAAAQKELDEIEAKSNSLARQQVSEAARQALADTDLSEEEKAEIQEKIVNSIDLSGITEQLRSNMQIAANQLTEIPVLNIPDISIDFSGIMSTVKDMQSQMEILQSSFNALSGMASQLSAVEGALETLKDGAGQLRDGSVQLTEGITVFNQGIEQLYNGSVQLSSGTKELSTAGSSLSDGLNALVQGLQQLEDGVKTFDEEGIQSLSDLAGDDLSTVITRLKALKEADGSYNNFAGIKEGQTGSVRFIIETEEIAAQP